MAARGREGDSDDDSELEFEDEDSTVIKRYRDILEERQGDLAKGIRDPAAVMRPLMKYKILNKMDWEEIMAKATTQEKNDKLIAILMTRNAVKAFVVLVDALWRVDPHLANGLQPVQSTVVWFASNPVHAAAIADTLQKYAGVKLGAVQGGVDYLCRQSRGKVFDLEDVRLWLVFPARLANKKRPSSIPDMVKSALSQIWPKVTLAVMSGVCDGVGGRVIPGRPIFVTEAVKPHRSSEGTSADSVGPTPGDIETARQQTQTQPTWLAEVESSHSAPSSLQYQSHWLARLYSEIQRVREEEKSQWLESIGWDVTNPAMLSEQHRAILSSKLSDWQSGKLVSALLRERALWQVDPSSPLGLTPSASLLRRLDDNLRSNPDYLAHLEARSPDAVHFGVMATSEENTAEQSTASAHVWPPPEALGCDSDSLPFLESCRACLDSTCPRLVCKVVRYDTKETESTCVVTSTRWLVEAVKSFVQNRE